MTILPLFSLLHFIVYCGKSFQFCIRQPTGYRPNGYGVGPKILDTTFQFDDNTTIALGSNMRGQFQYFKVEINPKSLLKFFGKNQTTPASVDATRSAMVGFFSTWTLVSLLCCIFYSAYRNYGDLLSPEMKMVPLSKQRGTSRFRAQHLIPTGFLSQQVFIDLALQHNTTVEEEQFFFKQNASRFCDLSKHASVISISMIIGTGVRSSMQSLHQKLPPLVQNSGASQTFCLIATVVVSFFLSDKVVDLVVAGLELPYKSSRTLNKK